MSYSNKNKYKDTYKEKEKKSKYVDLLQNGRLFPSWVLANYSRYTLPEIIKDPTKDACVIKDNKKELRAYQLFIGQYLDFQSPHREMLIYHAMGSGKTATSSNIINLLYNYTPSWNVFILVKASLTTNWLGDLKLWLSTDEYDQRFKNIHFISYDSPYADKKFLEVVKQVDSSKKNLYFIDEVHNFIRNVYSNVTLNTGKRAQVIYDYIQQNKKEDSDTRLILLSATPAINNPFEIALLMNLLRPGSFPTSESEFNRLFVSESNFRVMNSLNKNMFQRRILGLVSYYIGSTPDLYASKNIIYVDVLMSPYQEDVYKFYEEIEEKIARKAKLSSKNSSKSKSTYKSYTRQACNFVFPNISQNINGESRPRPNKFKISEKEAREYETANLDKTKPIKVINLDAYAKALKTYTSALINYFNDFSNKDIKANHTLLDDVNTYIKKYNKDYVSFHTKEVKKSSLYTIMHTCSAKMLHCIFNIMISEGPCQVYSNYVYLEGLEIFKIYLSYFGFYSYNDNHNKLKENRVGYVEFHGGITKEDRISGMKLFNDSNNKYGEKLKIILISPAGSEGLNLLNVRQVHILEPYWNEVRINQMIGRAIRQCSHKELTQENRKVDVFRYRSIRVLSNKPTTDQYIEDLARTKDSLIQSFLDAVIESAVDCELFKNHNKLVHKYSCFKFDEPSLFEDNIAPAYKQDIVDDEMMNNGLNSLNSTNQKIKVVKIKAVKIISKPDQDVKYSKMLDYWYYPSSGVVYDYDLNYAIGKVGRDENNIPLKLDKDTYIIDKVIPIPMLE
jgi:SNF2 family DNA or RNA helicase